MPYLGEILANTYQIVDEIGKGGAGIIYRAFHINLQKYVVVKKIKDNFVGNLNARGEVDILKRLHHSCLPQVYDFLQIGSEIYTVMDYIEGYDLKYYIDNGYIFSEENLWIWLQQLVDVLEYLHKHGILHSDIKPANIMISNEGKAYLIDFNISLEGEDNLIGLSEAYAAPEQIMKWQGFLYRNQNQMIVLDERMDIFSLGGTFYQLMTGQPPSPYPNQMIPINQIPLPYSPDLTDIVQKMTYLNREKRFQSAGQIKQAIMRKMRTKAEKNTLRLVFVAMLLAVLVLGGAIISVILLNRGGVSQAKLQEIREYENYLADLYDNEEYETAFHDGIKYYQSEYDVLVKAEGAVQSILERIVDSGIGSGQYRSTEKYLNTLMEMDEKVEYYQDLAVIAAYQGKITEAYEALDKALELGGNAEDIEKSKADIYAAQGDYANAISILEKYADSTNSGTVYRKLAVLNLNAATAVSDKAQAKQHALAAIGWYKKQEEIQWISYSGKMELVTAYCIAEQEDMALMILNGMLPDTEHYETYLQLGILCYRAEMRKAPASRNFTLVKQYAQQAELLWKQNKNDKTDERLDELLAIVKDLS